MFTFASVNIRLDKRIAGILARIRWIRFIRFSCDQISQIEAVERTAELLEQHGKKPYMQDRAIIDKTPEPFRVMEKSRDGIFRDRFTARAQPDFQGTLAGGRSIVFEEKYTATSKMRREILTDAQKFALEQHHNAGALAAVCAGIRDKFFFVPWLV